MRAVSYGPLGWVVGGGSWAPLGFDAMARGRLEGVLVAAGAEPPWRRLFSSGGEDVVRAVEPVLGADAFWVGGSFAGPMPGGGAAFEGVGRRAAWLRVDAGTGDVEEAWSLRPVDGPGRNEAHLADLAVAPDGAVVLGGWFYGEVDVDPGPGRRVLAAGARSGFVVVVEPEGELRWVYTTPEATVVGVSADASGVYITGNLHMPDRPASPVDRASAGVETGEDAFVEAIDRAGTSRWRLRIVSPGNDSGNAIAVDARGLVAVGYVGGPAEVAGARLGSRGRADAYVLGLDRGGKLQWHHHFGGPASDVANAVALHGDEVAVGGRFRGEVDFALGGLGPGGSWRARGAPRGSGFVVRYDRAGRERALFVSHPNAEAGSRRIDGLAYAPDGRLAAVGGTDEGDGGYALILLEP